MSPKRSIHSVASSPGSVEPDAEVLVKVLDACSFTASPAYWVFFAATTNVDFTLHVTDTHTGLTKEYKNLLGQAALPVQDTQTFKTCGQ